ncbi:MAG TPA: hypothetical protein VGK58_08140, partial [Lacipirellulaceae bacterium]
MSYNRDMRFRLDLLRAIAVTVIAALSSYSVDNATAQILEDEDTAASAARFGEAKTIRFRVGAEITASRGACRGIVAMVTVPLECPEQDVEILSEDFSSEVGEVTYRMLQGGARQMLISVPFLPAGATARAYITTEVTT